MSLLLSLFAIVYVLGPIYPVLFNLLTLLFSASVCLLLLFPQPQSPSPAAPLPTWCLKLTSVSLKAEKDKEELFPLSLQRE